MDDTEKDTYAQEITEALDIEKRKDRVVIRGIQESEDMDEKVGMAL